MQVWSAKRKKPCGRLYDVAIMAEDKLLLRPTQI